MNILFYLYEGLLLAYTGWRTFDFMTTQLPAGDGTTQILALAFLGSTELGLILWHWINRKHTTTHMQEQVASTMQWIDFLASMLAGVADMIIRQTMLDGYNIPATLAYILIYGLPAIMALNVGAGLVYKENDADEMLERAKKRTAYKIHKAGLQQLEEQADVMAQNMRGPIYQNLRDEVVSRVNDKYNLPKALPKEVLAEPAPKGSETVTFQSEVTTNEQVNPTMRQQ